DGLDAVAAAGRLVDSSLVVALEGGGEARYRMLDTIRQYAADRLEEAGEAAATRDRHLDWFLGLAEAAEPVADRDPDRRRETLPAEHATRGAAGGGARAPADRERGGRPAAAMARWWFLRGHTQEGLGALNRAVERAADARSELQASLLSGLALVAMGAGRPA